MALHAFPPSVIGVATGVPIFVGYTEKAPDRPMTPIAIGSIADFIRQFGGRHEGRCNVIEVMDPAQSDFQAATTEGSSVTIRFYALQNQNQEPFGPAYNLYTAMRLFYDNGGAACFVVSAGPYGAPVAKANLLAGIEAATGQAGATMLVVPDACLLPGQGAGSDYAAVAVAMLNAAESVRDRLAILDLPEALDPAKRSLDGLASTRDAFYSAIAPAAHAFSFGAAYAPALDVSVLGNGDVTYADLKGSTNSSATVNNILTTEAQLSYGANPDQFRSVKANIDDAFGSAEAPNPLQLNQLLLNTLPLFAQIMQILIGKLNVAPPSGIMAGIWAANDVRNGVWIAPANVALNSTIHPTVRLSDRDLATYNTPLNGNAVDILRYFASQGTVVWGARTLDGNNDDWRYIQVRRTIVYIEQSIETALQPFVFAANDGQTWVTVTSIVSNFLTSLWRSGALQGASPRDGFNVQCGLGSSMTAQDILDGRLVVDIGVAMVRPAEFVVIQIVLAMRTC